MMNNAAAAASKSPVLSLSHSHGPAVTVILRSLPNARAAWQAGATVLVTSSIACQ